MGGGASSPEWRARAKEAKARDNYQCVECGVAETLETDHIIELSRGGSNEFDNLQTLCKECHHLKTQKNRRRRSYT
ncbi:MAG: HNH endonuclease [Planctomycetaceae bacterium]|nr:HNH endonuclease [Planctomycetaceae bacterium]